MKTNSRTAYVSNQTAIHNAFLQAIVFAFLIVAISANGTSFSLSTTELLEGPTGGTDSFILTVTQPAETWSATTDTPWLHLNATNGNTSSLIVFSCDSNPGSPREGNITIAGQTVSIIQAGSAYVQAPAMPFISSGLSNPVAVAVSGANELYIIDGKNQALKKWNATDNILSTEVSWYLHWGFYWPNAITIDQHGTVYMLDSYSVEQWSPVDATLTIIGYSEFNAPEGIAVDEEGNLYIADTGNNVIKKWTATNNTISTLVSSGLKSPSGVAVDRFGNLYISDWDNNSLKKWTVATKRLTTVCSSVFSRPGTLAIDSAGNVLMTDVWRNTVKKWKASNNTLTTVASGLQSLSGIAVDVSGNVFFADPANNTIERLPQAFLDPTPKLVDAVSGTDSLAPVVPLTTTLAPPFAPSSDQPWLSITGITNGVVSFAFDACEDAIRTAHLSLLGQPIWVTQRGSSYTSSNSLNPSTFLVGPTAGTNIVKLSVSPQLDLWDAVANSPWLHLSTVNQSGHGSTNVVFSYDANTGATRTGTLTIAGQTLTVTQAGSNYVPAKPVSLIFSGLSTPCGLAVDDLGDVYVADCGDNTIKRWTASNNTVNTLIASGLSGPKGVAVDAQRNVYIADTTNNTIKKWVSTNGSVITLISGLSQPKNLALDAEGNLYVTTSSTVKKWTASSNTISTLFYGTFEGVAVDCIGNVYLADDGNHSINRWSVADGVLSTIVQRLSPTGLALDPEGNIYFATRTSTYGQAGIYKWTAANNTVTTILSAGLQFPCGVATDYAGSLYFSDSIKRLIQELPHAFVQPAAKSVGADAGCDSFPPVLPDTANLPTLATVTSDRSWFSIGDVTNGIVTFTYEKNTGADRTAQIDVLGQPMFVTQQSPPFFLGTNELLEGPSAGNDSIILVARSTNSSWTATTDCPWLHLSPGNQNGKGSTNVAFSFDPNDGATRTGALTIAEQRLTITQAGCSYVPAPAVPTTLISGVDVPEGVAVDAAGNVYAANPISIREWVASNNTVITLISDISLRPEGLAADSAGNIYISDPNHGAINRWTQVYSSLSRLVSGLSYPISVAVSSAGNVYIADYWRNAIRMWSVTNNSMITLASALQSPNAVAVDAAGNVYFTEPLNHAIKKWTASTKLTTTVISSGLGLPGGIAVDRAGSVYFADINHTIKKWTPGCNTTTTLASSGFDDPMAFAVDAVGGVYFAEALTNTIKELPHAFLDPTGKVEGFAAGNDVLPPVLPSTINLLPPFAPTSDQPWLTITGTTNSSVSFSFSANTGATRTANITLLNARIPITQEGPPKIVDLTILENRLVTFTFSNHNANDCYSIVSSTNIELPINEWTVLGIATNVAPDRFEFTTPISTNSPQRFYRLRLP